MKVLCNVRIKKEDLWLSDEWYRAILDEAEHCCGLIKVACPIPSENTGSNLVRGTCSAQTSMSNQLGHSFDIYISKLLFFPCKFSA